MIEFREANIGDITTYFKWLNDPEVRLLSFSNTKVTFKAHQKWFQNKINDKNCIMLVFLSSNNEIGQIRIEKAAFSQAIISISIASEYRGKGYAVEMLNMASKYFHSKNPEFIINAYIKNNNLNSIYSFEKACYKFYKKLKHKGHNCLNYILENANT